MILEILSQLIVYGLMGLLIEVIFTGLYSVIVERNKQARSTTSLWMSVIYAIGGLGVDLLRSHVSTALFIPLAVLLIYVLEFSYGWTLRQFGIIPWNYKLSKWAPYGLINFKYLPFWTALVVGFNVVRSLL